MLFGAGSPVGHFDSFDGASGHFEEPVTVRRPFDLRVSALDYVANLSTQSGFRQLAADAGAELLKRVHRRIEASGGLITVHRLAVLTARRAVAFGSLQELFRTYVCIDVAPVIWCRLRLPLRFTDHSDWRM